MDTDHLQRAWRTQASLTRVTIDVNLLLNEVRRSEQSFRAMTFLRDCREIGVAIVMIPLWIYCGVKGALPWTWYLTVPALVWIAAFMLAYRIRYKRPHGTLDEPLLRCVERSVTEVEYQIWLLRNVFWWYLLPFVIALSPFFAHVVLGVWMHSRTERDGLGLAGVFFLAAILVFVFVVLMVAVSAVYYFVYRLNQYAVQTQLEPRRQELLTLLASLGDEISPEKG